MLTLAASKVLAIGKMAVIAAMFSNLAAIGPVPLANDMREVGSRLAVSRYEVTTTEWQRCAASGACAAFAGTPMPNAPMTGVNAFDVQGYITWLNAQTHHRYRLPTADEWHAAASDLPRQPFKKLFDDPRLAWAADYGSMEQVSAVIRPSGHFGTFANGISDLVGNVWKWTSTCAAKGFSAAECPAFMVEGLHETALSVFVRDPASGGCAVGAPPANIGFRLVEDR